MFNINQKLKKKKMDSKINQMKTEDELDSEKIDLNYFFNLVGNSTEVIKYLDNFTENLNEFLLLNNSHVNRLNELLFKINSEKSLKQLKLINTPIEKIIKIFKKMIQMQIQSLEAFLTKIYFL